MLAALQINADILTTLNGDRLDLIVFDELGEFIEGNVIAATTLSGGSKYEDEQEDDYTSDNQPKALGVTTSKGRISVIVVLRFVGSVIHEDGAKDAVLRAGRASLLSMLNLTIVNSMSFTHYNSIFRG